MLPPRGVSEEVAMTHSVADRGSAVLSNAICAQALAVYEVLQRRLECCEVDASFTSSLASAAQRLERRAEAQPWPVTPLVAVRADHILAAALHAEAPIAAASWCQTLPDAILSLLERRVVVVPSASRTMGVPRPRRRATDR
jgi:hypothetical protein